MSPDPYTDTADSIVEHAHAITRLDIEALGEAGADAALARHLQAMRVLAAAHVDPTPDRGFFKALKAATARTTGVFVHLDDGVIGFIVDHPQQQLRFELLSPRQLQRRGEVGSLDLR